MNGQYRTMTAHAGRRAAVSVRSLGAPVKETPKTACDQFHARETFLVDIDVHLGHQHFPTKGESVYTRLAFKQKRKKLKCMRPSVHCFR
jgi:hypothetical protein